MYSEQNRNIKKDNIILDISAEIERLKTKIFHVGEDNNERGELIERLISLRLRRDELTEKVGPRRGSNGGCMLQYNDTIIDTVYSSDLFHSL